jgi:hypothetical protein
MRYFLLLFWMGMVCSAEAQQHDTRRPTVFFATGLVVPQFYGGTELMATYSNRQNGLSHFAAADGSRAEVGSYGSNTGFSLAIGYYVPIQKITGLSVGLLVNSAQTGATPTKAGYAEGYFFNFLNFSGAFQYTPFVNNGLYVHGELGMGSVFTKNRFINAAGEQDFLHHFGIGLEGGAALGYTFRPFASQALGLFVEGQYQFYQTRVEVSGLGDDQWRFGALRLTAGIKF